MKVCVASVGGERGGGLGIVGSPPWSETASERSPADRRISGDDPFGGGFIRWLAAGSLGAHPSAEMSAASRIGGDSGSGVDFSPFRCSLRFAVAIRSDPADRRDFRLAMRGRTSEPLVRASVTIPLPKGRKFLPRFTSTAVED
jgi:hypothetical protein